MFFQSHRSDCDLFWSVSQRVRRQACVPQTSSSWVTPPSLSIHVYVHMCLMASERRIPKILQRQSTDHYSLGGWARHGQCYTDTQWDSLVERTHTQCLNPLWHFKSFSASLGESLAQMMIKATVLLHNGESKRSINTTRITREAVEVQQWFGKVEIRKMWTERYIKDPSWALKIPVNQQEAAKGHKVKKTTEMTCLFWVLFVCLCLVCGSTGNLFTMHLPFATVVLVPALPLEVGAWMREWC